MAAPLTPRQMQILRAQFLLSQKNPHPHLIAQMDPSNIGVWYFLLVMGAEPPFRGGEFLIRLTAGAGFPQSPPSLEFLTETGVFETGGPVCVSIGEFHAKDAPGRDGAGGYRASLGMVGFADQVWGALIGHKELTPGIRIIPAPRQTPQRLKFLAQISKAQNHLHHRAHCDRFEEFARCFPTLPAVQLLRRTRAALLAAEPGPELPVVPVPIARAELAAAEAVQRALVAEEEAAAAGADAAGVAAAGAAAALDERQRQAAERAAAAAAAAAERAAAEAAAAEAAAAARARAEAEGRVAAARAAAAAAVAAAAEADAAAAAVADGLAKVETFRRSVVAWEANLEQCLARHRQACVTGTPESIKAEADAVAKAQQAALYWSSQAEGAVRAQRGLEPRAAAAAKAAAAARAAALAAAAAAAPPAAPAAEASAAGGPLRPDNVGGASLGDVLDSLLDDFLA
jgi:hypothetical protein